MFLSDLVRHKPLCLELATPLVTDRVVTGAHAIEVPEPAQWIGPGYVVLTTGMALKRSPERQRRFVHGLADADATALGFGVDVVFKSVPRPMLETAEERGLPLFRVPYEIAFRDIIRYVMSSTLRGEAAQLERAIAIQDHLLAAMESPDAVQSVVDRLGDLLEARAALFASDGRVVAVAGHPPLEELWNLAASGARAVPFGRGYALIREVEAAGSIRYYLAVLLRSQGRVEALGRPVSAFAARALQMIVTSRQIAAEHEGVARAALLQDLLDSPQVDRELAERMQAFGFLPAQPLRILVASVPAGGDRSLREVQSAIERILERGGAPRLADVVVGEVVVLWQGEEIPHAELAAERAAVGLAAPLATPGELPRALAEARACLLAAREAETDFERIVSFERLSLADSLLALLPGDRVARASDVLAPLRDERPEMMETLISLFEHDLDIVACARSLYLHPNSLRYRLAKIESKLGRSLRSPATIADVHLAIRTRAMYGQRP